MKLSFSTPVIPYGAAFDPHIEVPNKTVVEFEFTTEDLKLIQKKDHYTFQVVMNAIRHASGEVARQVQIS